MSKPTKIDSTHVVVLIGGVLLGGILAGLPAMNKMKEERGRTVPVQVNSRVLVKYLNDEGYTQKDNRIGDLVDQLEASINAYHE